MIMTHYSIFKNYLLLNPNTTKWRKLLFLFQELNHLYRQHTQRDCRDRNEILPWSFASGQMRHGRINSAHNMQELGSKVKKWTISLWSMIYHLTYKIIHPFVVQGFQKIEHHTLIRLSVLLTERNPMRPLHAAGSGVLTKCYRVSKVILKPRWKNYFLSLLHANLMGNCVL